MFDNSMPIVNDAELNTMIIVELFLANSFLRSLRNGIVVVQLDVKEECLPEGLLWFL